MNVYTLYSAIQKFGISKIFNTIQIYLLCSSRLHLFDQKCRKKL